jgi:hypothetical protein
MSTAPSAKSRPVFVVKLRPEPTCQNPVRALRAALKFILRRHALQAVSIVEASK